MKGIDKLGKLLANLKKKIDESKNRDFELFSLFLETE